MKLKGTVVATIIAVLSSGVLADDAHHPDKAGKPAAEQLDAKNTTGMGNMATMQDNMKRMHDQMQKVHATSDPKERQRLMDEHMKTMHEAMYMMDGMSGGGMAPGADGRMKMELCMDMMKTLMQQMVAQRAERSTPK